MKSLNSQERKRENEMGRNWDVMDWGWCCDLGQNVRDLPDVFASKACDGS